MTPSEIADLVEGHEVEGGGGGGSEGVGFEVEGERAGRDVREEEAVVAGAVLAEVM